MISLWCAYVFQRSGYAIANNLSKGLIGTHLNFFLLRAGLILGIVIAYGIQITAKHSDQGYDFGVKGQYQIYLKYMSQDLI